MRNVSDLYKILADKYGKSEEAIREIVSFPDEYLASHMRNKNTDQILMHKWGTYKISLYHVNKKINKILFYYRKGVLSRKKTVEEISKLWEMRNAAKKQSGKE